jgi:hypothetical protein
MKNSYLKLHKDPSTDQFHPLLAGLEDATRIINGVNRVIVKPAMHQSYVPLTVVPSYPDLPMEEVFARPAKTVEAGVFLTEIGRGRVVYFPWDLDRTFWDVLDVDHGKLIRNAVLWATNEDSPVSVKGPGILDVTVWTQKQSMTVHLVNLTNPMMMKGPLREIVPLPGQQVRVRVPPVRRVIAVRLLAARREVPYKEVNGAVELQVPSIGLHEVVALDFAG